MLAVTQRTLQLLLQPHHRLRHRHRHLVRGKTGVGEDGEEGEEGGEGEEGEGEGEGGEGEEGEGGADTRVLEAEVQGKHIYSQYSSYLFP